MIQSMGLEQWSNIHMFEVQCLPHEDEMAGFPFEDYHMEIIEGENLVIDENLFISYEI